jgi:isoquinoline 1-oxidoreductase alpha subunit
MIRVIVNGTPRDLDVDPAMPLLWALRDVLGITGPKFGCGKGLCGACTVHVDGAPLRACVTPVASIAGKTVTTIEGLTGPVADAVFAAWEAADVVQCGWCQPGQVMSACALLARTPRPDAATVDAAMAGNLCRCGTYQRIRAAIADAARTLAEGATGAENAGHADS